jgi:hypothetical protein
MAYGSVLTDVVQSSTTGSPSVFKDGTGTQIGTLCRAWVNFDGVTTATIRASFNVSSVTRNGTGDYTINFTNAMPDSNYSAGTLCGYANAGNPYRYAGAYTWSTTSLQIYTFYTSGGDTKYDSGYVTVAIFR